MASYYGFRAMGLFDGGTGTHFLAGAAHFYDTYDTADGKFVSIGPLEPQFYSLLIDKLRLDRERFAAAPFSLQPGGMDPAAWAPLKAELAAVFRTRTRDEWCSLLEGSDVCFAPVLTVDEAAKHPHNRARETFTEVGGVLQHAPAPRFDRTPAAAPQPPPLAGSHSRTVLSDAGYADSEIDALLRDGVVAEPAAEGTRREADAQSS